VIDPISELLLLLQSLWKGAGAFFHTLAFLRERRQLGYALCRAADEKHVNDLSKWIVPRFTFLASIFACIAIFLIGVEQVSLFMGMGDQAYFAGLLKDLSAWWNDLSTLEKGAMIVTTVVLGGLLTVLTGGGFLAGSIGALGAALSMKDILDNPDPLVAFIENPKAAFAEWKKQFFNLTPSEATGLAAVIIISFLLDRLPAKRIMDLVLDNLREGVQHLTRKLFPPVLQVEMGGGKWNIPVKWMPDNYWQSSSHGGSGGKVPERTGDFKPLKEVEIVDKNGRPIGEFDEIDMKNGIIYEDKTAKGLDILNPKTGLPAQTAQQFADKQILTKTRNRINNLQNSAVSSRPTANGSPEVPSLEEIKGIRQFVFRLDGDTPELREAVERSLEQLRKEFPEYTFDVQFGGKK